MDPLDELKTAILQQGPEIRAELARLLLDSLESLSPEENERLWAEEAQRRDAALDRGRLEEIPAGEVLRELRARLT
ncbi:MAG: addiction module protein [Acidobacteria bacterium]|nr:addiction module protein [Acidobacteriota bacterium]MCG3194996.1 hypothetical protein [Thermoanaerobaculia bacterium]MCK6685088.1 addiction module protein [Thermoanaerobaculia bacterium]